MNIIIAGHAGFRRLCLSFYVRRIHAMLKRTIKVCLILICGLVVFCMLAGQAERTAYMKEQRHFLKIAADDFIKYGYVTNTSGNTLRFYLSSNTVTIAGTKYQCYAEVTGGQFGDEGTLAITTNQVFIWLGHDREPKIIGDTYKASVGHF